LEKNIALREARKKAHERADTINMINRFIKMKSYKGLMIGIKRELRSFLGFREVGILFYDREKEKFFQ
jgi:hypothetical protein